jgi:hypothetical protein
VVTITLVGIKTFSKSAEGNNHCGSPLLTRYWMQHWGEVDRE